MTVDGERVVYAGGQAPEIDVWVDDDLGGRWVEGQLLMSTRVDHRPWRHLVRWWTPGGRRAHTEVVADARVRRDDPSRYGL